MILTIEESGYRVAWAARPEDLPELLEQGPQAMVVVAEAEERAEMLLQEIRRARPLVPILVAPTQRDAARSVELLRLGAQEVISTPWTREILSACLSKALRFQGMGIEVVRPMERTRRGLFYAAAAALFFGAAFGYSLLDFRQERREAQPPAPTEWDLPYSHPAGMAFGRGDFWVADWYSRVIYRHDPRSRAVRRGMPLPQEPPTAIAFGGDCLWVVSASGVLSKHMLDDRLTVLSRYPAALGQTVGLAYDGLYLWSLDSRHFKLRKHLLDERMTVLQAYDYPGVKPAALAFDGKTLWSLDAANRELLRHDIKDPRLVVYRVPLREYQSGRWRPTGLVWDGEQFWSVAESSGGGELPGRLLSHELPRPLSKIPAS
ncbi:MAG: hypothetical protein HY551_01865 [Elusimicrobia bacterium]|nr:hypothetical protein [Elusimicrobiota bacterium]